MRARECVKSSDQHDCEGSFLETKPCKNKACIGTYCKRLKHSVLRWPFFSIKMCILLPGLTITVWNLPSTRIRTEVERLFIRSIYIMCPGHCCYTLHPCSVWWDNFSLVFSSISGPSKLSINQLEVLLRSSSCHRSCSIKKVFLKIPQNSQKKYLS